MGLGRSVILRADLLKILSEQITSSFSFQNTPIVTKLGYVITVLLRLEPAQ